jgi:hypothetical protein
MKPILVLTLIIIVSLSFADCKKKESNVPTVPRTNDSTKTDSVIPTNSVHTDSTPHTYPTMNTYQGQLVSKFDGNPTETNSTFLFSVGVVKTPTDSIAFNSVTTVSSFNKGSIVFAQFAVNDSNSYACATTNDFTLGGSYTFKIVNDSLYVTWDYSQQLIGTCYDVGECRGHFAGKINR